MGNAPVTAEDQDYARVNADSEDHGDYNSNDDRAYATDREVGGDRRRRNVEASSSSAGLISSRGSSRSSLSDGYATEGSLARSGRHPQQARRRAAGHRPLEISEQDDEYYDEERYNSDRTQSTSTRQYHSADSRSVPQRAASSADVVGSRRQNLVRPSAVRDADTRRPTVGSRRIQPITQTLRKGLCSTSDDYDYLRLIDIWIMNHVLQYTSIFKKIRDVNVITEHYRHPAFLAITEDISMHNGSAAKIAKDGNETVAETGPIIPDIPSSAHLASQYCQLAILVPITDLALNGVTRRDMVAPPARISNLFHVVHAFYDFFMIGCTAEVAHRGDQARELSASMAHPLGAVLCDKQYVASARSMNDYAVGSRMRMNANEYVIASLVRNSNRNMTAIIHSKNENGDAGFYYVVVPTKYSHAVFDRIKKAAANKLPAESIDIPPMGIDDLLEIQRIQLLLFYGIEADSVASKKYEIHCTDSRLYAKFGANAVARKIITDIVVNNLVCLIQLVVRVNEIMKSRLVTWVRIANSTIYQIALGEDSKMCADSTLSVGAQSIAYPMADKPIEMLITDSSVHASASGATSSAVRLQQHYGATKYSMSSGHAQIESFNKFARSRQELRNGPFLENVLQHAVLSKKTCNKYAKLMEFFALKISYMVSYPELRQLFVIAGTVNIFPLPSNAEMALVTQECWLSLASFVVANMRFAPMFDIVLAVRDDRGAMECKEYRVDCFDSSARMIFDSISHSNEGRDLDISFTIDMETMRRCICRMPPVGCKEGAGIIPSDRSVVAFPITWLSSETRQYAKDMLSRTYARKVPNSVGIRKLSIYSIAQSQSARQVCAVVATDEIDFMSVMSPHAAVQRNAPLIDEGGIGSRSECLMTGGRLTMEATVANKVTHRNMDAHERYRIVRRSAAESGRSAKSRSSTDMPAGVESISTCLPVSAYVSVRIPSTFIDQDTYVECAESIEIKVTIRSATYQRVLREWMALYGFWPTNSYEVIRNLTMPTVSRDAIASDIAEAENALRARGGGAPQKSGNRRGGSSARTRRKKK